MTSNIEIEKQIIDKIENSIDKITQRDLEAALSSQNQTTPKMIRSLIRRLVSVGKLSYTNIHGHTFIEISYCRPVRVSDHIILKPAGLRDVKKGAEDIVIELMFGDAFGTGHHPTTRLALQGMEYLKDKAYVFNGTDNQCALDIGTGSGVLAIGAVKLGMARAIGLDIDPCACHEAMENVRLNNLGSKILISDNAPESFDSRFDLVLANLRCPTIISLCSQITSLTPDHSAIVFSGIKEEEVGKVVDVYKAAGFDDRWRKMEKGWAGLVFMK